MSSVVQVVIYVGLEKQISRDIVENKILKIRTPQFWRYK